MSDPMIEAAVEATERGNPRPTRVPTAPLASDFVCDCSGIPHAKGIARCVWSPRAVPEGHRFPCDAEECRRCAWIAWY